jgi:SM-20-related protein
MIGTDVKRNRSAIKVIDDFLPMYDEVAEMIAREPLTFGSRSNARTDPHGHWSQSFADAARTNLADVAGDLSNDERLAPIRNAWEFLRDAELSEAVLIRCYLNGYTYGTDGYFHTDSQRPDEHTAVIYINDYWEPDWGGETVFLNAQNEICQSVLPKRNRAVIFPSAIQHAGRGVSRKCTALRRTLIFKARRKRSVHFEKLSVFLREAGATRLSHKSGTLHDHLVRTFALLEARGVSAPVCFAGGLHSVFGTNAYKTVLLAPDQGRTVHSEFGREVENLASLFARLERPETLEKPLQLGEKTALVRLRSKETMMVDRQDFDHLRLIECANLADQDNLNRYKALHAIWRSLPAHAETESSPSPPSANCPSSSSS